jgi:hypothetical protein
MINRAKMPRQLRNKGGITNVVPRENYGLGSKIKDRIRKLIPNEIASVASKAAPFVAPFNPAIAGLMRGIGRFDKRGSLSDAFKQGLGTYAAGQLFREIGGAGAQQGFGTPGDRFTSPLSPDRTTAVKDFFTPGKEKETDFIKKVTGDTKKDVGLKSIKDATGLFKDVPILKDLPSLIQQQILVGGASGALTYIYQKFLADEPPQQEGETYDQYITRRRENVGRKMKGYFDNYFKFDKEYSSMTDEEKQAFIDRVNIRDGGRVGYGLGSIVRQAIPTDTRQVIPTGISMGNTLAENIARNRANQAAISKVFQAAASKAFPEGKFQKIKASSPTQKDYNIKATEDLVRNLPGGIVRDASASAAAGVLSLPYDAIQAATRTTESDINRAMQTGALTPRDIASEAFGLAYARENPLSSAIERTIGAAGPLAERLSQPDILDVGFDPLTETTPTPDSEFENTMRKITADSEGFAAYAGIVPGFKARKRSDGRFEYKAPDGQIYGPETYASIAAGMYPNIYDPRANVAGGGMPTGIMRSNKAGVMERDYRETGGFVPVGIKEKADDVPAMLSKNEFVFTADAVRGAGNGSIEKGAQRMYDTMKKLEKRVV